MSLPAGVIPLDGPMEFECRGCGRHQVLDPDELRDLARRRRFVCHRCGQSRPRRELHGVGFAEHHRLVGICVGCSPDLTPSFYVGLR